MDPVQVYYLIALLLNLNVRSKEVNIIYVWIKSVLNKYLINAQMVCVLLQNQIAHWVLSLLMRYNIAR